MRSGVLGGKRTGEEEQTREPDPGSPPLPGTGTHTPKVSRKGGGGIRKLLLPVSHDREFLNGEG